MKHATVEKAMWATGPDMVEFTIQSGEPHYAAPGIDMSTLGWVLLGTATITQEFRFDSAIKQDAADMCDEAISKLRADTEVKIAHLKEVKQKLLALEYTLPAKSMFAAYCQDEGCPHRGKLGVCEPKIGGCSFTEYNDDIPF